MFLGYNDLLGYWTIACLKPLLNYIEIMNSYCKSRKVTFLTSSGGFCKWIEIVLRCVVYMCLTKSFVFRQKAGFTTSFNLIITSKTCIACSLPAPLYQMKPIPRRLLQNPPLQQVDSFSSFALQILPSTQLCLQYSVEWRQLSPTCWLPEAIKHSYNQYFVT